ncbi:hypothetical protein [Endozoicomonas atrinae]|uniref:hypothetical protein n=1 Tax=Endozoicomonas atrinae TaxID=1333660 RepID=UPI003AFF726E
MTRPFKDSALLAIADQLVKSGKGLKDKTVMNSAENNYSLDHKIYKNSAMNDLECNFPGITLGCWDDLVDKVKWQWKIR